MLRQQLLLLDNLIQAIVQFKLLLTENIFQLCNSHRQFLIQIESISFVLDPFTL